LALRQAGTNLGAALGREHDPVAFVVSTRLSTPDGDDPPATDRLDDPLGVHDDLAFKLDPTPSSRPSLSLPSGST
jgi:hypothetical protein